MYDFDNVFSILTNDQMTAKVDCKIQDAGFKICCKKKIIIFCEVFVNSNERFVPLHRRKKDGKRMLKAGRNCFQVHQNFRPAQRAKNEKSWFST